MWKKSKRSYIAKTFHLCSTPIYFYRPHYSQAGHFPISTATHFTSSSSLSSYFVFFFIILLHLLLIFILSFSSASVHCSGAPWPTAMMRFLRRFESPSTGVNIETVKSPRWKTWKCICKWTCVVSPCFSRWSPTGNWHVQTYSYSGDGLWHKKWQKSNSGSISVRSGPIW